MRSAHGTLHLEHNFMTDIQEKMSDEEFWKGVNGTRNGLEGVQEALRMADVKLQHSEVRVLVELGMVLVKGQLFRMNLVNVQNVRSLESFEAAIRSAETYRVVKVVPSGFTFTGGVSMVAGRVGMFMLFFHSSWAPVRGAFLNYVLLDKWMPGCRTCMGWVQWMQGRARRARRYRRCLPVAMALHARLGADSGIASLGEDLLRKICESN